MFVPIWLAREAGNTCTASLKQVSQQHLNQCRFSLKYHLSVANQFAMSSPLNLATSGQKPGQTVTKSRPKQDKFRPHQDRHLSCPPHAVPKDSSATQQTLQQKKSGKALPPVSNSTIRVPLLACPTVLEKSTRPSAQSTTEKPTPACCRGEPMCSPAWRRTTCLNAQRESRSAPTSCTAAPIQQGTHQTLTSVNIQ